MKYLAQSDDETNLIVLRLLVSGPLPWSRQRVSKAGDCPGRTAPDRDSHVRCRLLWQLWQHLRGLRPHDAGLREGHGVRLHLLAPLANIRRQTPDFCEAPEPWLDHEKRSSWLSSLLCPLLIIRQVITCSSNVGRLLALVSTTQQEHGPASFPCVVNAIPRSPINAQFRDSVAEIFRIAEVANGKAINSCCDPCASLIVGEPRQPIAENVFSIAGDIPSNLNLEPLGARTQPHIGHAHRR